MFGYILPYRKTLSEESTKQYHADYCGLCRQLKEQYGFRGRFLVSYDVTFLYALLSAQEEVPGVQRCRCPAHPFCRRDCTVCSDMLSFCADITVILSWWKLRDTLADEGFFRRQMAKLLLALYKKPYQKAQRARPELARRAEEHLSRLSELETEKSRSIDRTADAFAQLLACCIPAQDEPAARIDRQILYHTGRYLYLIDALDDLEKDRKKNAYNPLLYRYCEAGETLSAEDRNDVLQTILCSVHEIETALQLLAPVSHAELLENIISCGMPIAARAVAAGVFRKKVNRRKL